MRMGPFGPAEDVVFGQTREGWDNSGTLCFAPASGLSVGVRTAEVLVSDPTDPLANLRETHRWTFTVAP